jgi:hypothetical protein
MKRRIHFGRIRLKQPLFDIATNTSTLRHCKELFNHEWGPHAKDDRIHNKQGQTVREAKCKETQNLDPW